MSDADKYPSQTAERFQIRMPEGLRDRIRVAAEENNRSMNAEIIARLEASFDENIVTMSKDDSDLISKALAIAVLKCVDELGASGISVPGPKKNGV